MKKCHIISVGAGKGGVGKSTISKNFAISLATAGYKTLIVDGDVQANTTHRLCESKVNVSLMNFKKAIDNNTEFSISEIIKETIWENLSIIPSSSNIEELNTKTFSGTEDDFYYLEKFQNEIENLREYFDFIVFDTNVMPHSFLTHNAINVSDLIIISVDYFESIDGLEKYINIVNNFGEKEIKILQNKYVNKDEISEEIEGLLIEDFKKHLFTYRRKIVHIPYNKYIMKNYYREKPLNVFKLKFKYFDCFRILVKILRTI